MLSGAAEVLQPGIETEQAPNPSSSSTVLDSKPAWGGASISTNATWGSPSPDSPEKSGSCSFRDLMSEDLAKHMQDKENELYIRAMIQGGADSSNLLDFKKSEDTSDDFLLAQMLQYEFDREHDQQLKREEKHYNGNSKVSVSFNKYKICPTWYGPDSDDDFEEVDEENRDFDSFEARERDDPLLSSRGYTKVGKQFVTKHDLMISGRKNAERIMNLPPGINTGDGGGFDMQLSNKVYNNLQHSAKSEIRRKNRIHDKVEKATSDMALDQNTRLLIFKWVNNVILESVNGIISAGKEAVVFHALGGEYEKEPLPEECAVKVFKTTLTDFKTREKYIREDYRFKDRMSRNNTQKAIRAWAEKEYHNLRRLQRAGIPSPKPLLIKKHVLLMSFIGKKHEAAPKLKEANLSFADLCIAYEQVVEAMVKMFRNCRLVHADMSEYNVLWHINCCYIIDVGQAVEPTHPHALQFLFRDCVNVIKFFSSKGLPKLLTPLQLFEKISGIKLPGPEEEAARMIEEYETHQEFWHNGMKNISDRFEHMWREIQVEEKRHTTALEDNTNAEVSDDESEEEINDNEEVDRVCRSESDCHKRQESESLDLDKEEVQASSTSSTVTFKDFYNSTPNRNSIANSFAESKSEYKQSNKNKHKKK